MIYAYCKRCSFFFFLYEVLDNDIAVQNESLKSRPTRFMEKLSYVHIDVPCKHVLTAGIYDHPVLNSRHIIIFTILTSSAVSRRSYYGRGRSSTVVAVVVYYPRRSSPPSVPAGPSLVSTAAAAAASLPQPAAAGLPACIRSERGEDPLAAPNGFFLIIKACGACNQNAVRLEADNSVAQQQR